MATLLEIWVERRQRVNEALGQLNVGAEEYCRLMGHSRKQYHAFVTSDPATAKSAQRPSIDALTRFCYVFDVSPTWLLFGVGRMWMNEIRQIDRVMGSINSGPKRPTNL